MGLQWQGLWTERDGSTPCFVRILTALGVLGYLGLTAWAIYKGQVVGYTEWATGFTVIVAGGAGAARLKLDTEGQAQ
ncbi:MAG: hypothetical protein KGL39_07265 [Patescibacteria group bacterium]|nr:hypothetical protein [Patescibacteria group bacterium]